METEDFGENWVRELDREFSFNPDWYGLMHGVPACEPQGGWFDF